MSYKNRDVVLGIENLESRKVCSIDPLVSNQWGLEAIKANVEAGSSSVVVAVIEGGFIIKEFELFC